MTTALAGLTFNFKDGGNLETYNLKNIEYKELRFEQGESYRGGWRDDQPEGQGIYTWSDGSIYEGSWHEGLKHGWGTYSWPNGAQYKGEWQAGLLQGYGTFRSPDGSVYQGSWQANLKHGIGKKTYANGDFYEGLWRHGKAEGPGRYVWHLGNVYDGEWRAGKMHGQGTLRWRTGERYDGEWREGQEDGVGVFTWQDESTYEGFWSKGKKEGVGVFRPASASRQAHPLDESRGKPDAPEVASGDQGEAAGLALAAAFDDPIDSPSISSGPKRDAAPELSEGGGKGAGGRSGKHVDCVYVCEYMGGRLAHEEALSSEDVEGIFGPMQQQIHRKRRLRRRSKRQQDIMGETIYKGHRSYDLMLNLQLGIRYTLTTLSKVPQPPEILPAHFQQKVWLRFPRNGSEVTPPHPSNDFKWKDYCPEAFRKLRDIFEINTSDYLLSICGDQALRELPSPGKSGSVFFISHDDQYMIKTMRKEEIKLLLSMLPRYLAHVSAHPNTLLLRFFGVHRVKPSHGQKVRFVVMNNVFRTEIPLHSKYDLKGSTLGRTVGAKMSATAIRKDLDLDVRFKVDSAQRARLMDQLAADCAFLEGEHVMDYSLLLGVHYRAHGETSASPLNTDKEDEGGTEGEELGTPHGRLRAAVPRRRDSAGGELRLPADDTDAAVVQSMHEPKLEHVSLPQAALEVERSGGSGSGNRSSFSFMFWRKSSREMKKQAQLAQLAQQAERAQRAQRANGALHHRQQQLGLANGPFQGAPAEPAGGTPSSSHSSPQQQQQQQPEAAHQVQPRSPPPARPHHPGDSSSGSITADSTPRVEPPSNSPKGGPSTGGSELATPAQAGSGSGSGSREPSRGGRPGNHQSEGPSHRSAGGSAAHGTSTASLSGSSCASDSDPEDADADASANSGSAAAGLSGLAGSRLLEPPQPPHLSPVQVGGRSLAPSGGTTPSAASPLQTGDQPSTSQPGTPSPQQQQQQQQQQGRGAASPLVSRASDASQQGQGQQEQQGQGQGQHGNASSVQPLSSSSPASPRDGEGSAKKPLVRWRSDAVRLPELVRPAAQHAATLRRHASAQAAGVPQALGAAPGAGAAAPAAQPSRLSRGFAAAIPAPSHSGTLSPIPSGPSIIANLPPIHSNASFSAASPQQPAPEGAEQQQEGQQDTEQQQGQQQQPEAASQAASNEALAGQAVPPAAAELPAGPQATPPPPAAAAAAPAAAATAAAAAAGSDAKPRRHTLPHDQLLGAGRSLAALVAAGAGIRSAPGSARTSTGLAGIGEDRELSSSEGMTSVGAAASGSPGAGARGVSSPSRTLDRAVSAPAASFEAFASAGVRLRGGNSGLMKCGPSELSESGEAGAAAPLFRRMATTGSRASGGLGRVQRPESGVDLTSPEALAIMARIRRKLERPVSDQLLQDLLKLARYKMLGKPGSNRSSFRAPTMVLAARSRRNSSLLESSRITSEDELGAAGVEQPGCNLPAVAVSCQAASQPEEVVLFCGIIDFLQEYNLRKMLEHNLKAVVQDGKAISVVEPRAYSKRFLNFMSTVFTSG